MENTDFFTYSLSFGLYLLQFLHLVSFLRCSHVQVLGTTPVHGNSKKN